MMERLENGKEQNEVKISKVGGILRTSIDKEIQYLEQAEKDFTDRLEQYEETDREWHTLLQESETAKKNLVNL